MSVLPRVIVFPISIKEFSSIRDFEDFLVKVVPNPKRNGIYHIRTKLEHPPMGKVPVGSVAVFRFFGQHLGHAKVKVGVKSQFDPKKIKIYPYYITFEPKSVSLFKRRITLADFRKIHPHPFCTRAYLDMTVKEYRTLVKLAGSQPLI